MSVSKADLEQYLSLNGLPTILVDMVENLLLKKPQNPHGFIVNYFMERFPNETSEIARAKLSSHQSSPFNISKLNNEVDPNVILNLLNEANNKESEDEDSIDDESDEESEDELSQPPTPPSPKSLGRRTSVCGERQESIMNDSSSIPNNPKLEGEYLEIYNVFKKHVLFKHLDEEQINLVQSAMSFVTKKKGEIIIKEGDDGDNFYAVKDGTVDVFKQQGGNDNKTNEDSFNDAVSDITRKEYECIYGNFVIKYPPGESFGELAILYNAPRAATCIASTDVELWALDRLSFKKILMSTAITKRNVRVHFLQRVSIFSQLTQQEIFSIADFMEEESFQENDVILNEGDPGRKFYIIKEGNANCVRSGEIVAQLEKGAYFGEIALITSKPRQATVVAKSTLLKCLTVDRKTFNRVMGPLQNILIRNMEEYKSNLNHPCTKVTGHYSI